MAIRLANDVPWHLSAKQGEPPSDLTIHKQYVADEVKEVEGEERTLDFTISTGSVDRDLDVISVGGWRIDSYLKNPVVLWAHDYHSLPLARAMSVEQQGERLRARAKFAEHPFAETVLQMLKGGFLKATSVGFRPLKWSYNEERRGVDFTEQELLEFSIVPVPANPEALMEAAAKGIDTAPLLQWAEAVLIKTGRPSHPDLFAEIKALRSLLEDSKGDHDECPMGEDCPMRGKSVAQKPRVMDPDEQGHCPAGYEMGDDGMCHEKAGGNGAEVGTAVVLTLADAPAEPTYQIDARMLQEALAELVADQVRGAVNALRGRVD